MPRSEFVPCTIERSAFSTERTFRVELHDNGSLVGTANVLYLRDASQQPLDRDTPALGETLDGFVQCRVVGVPGDGTILIELPSAEVIHIPADDLVLVE